MARRAAGRAARGGCPGGNGAEAGCGRGDGGFDGLATYEMCSPIRGGGSMENLDRYAADYLQWMRNQGLR